MKILLLVVSFSNSIEYKYLVIKDFGIIVNRTDTTSFISYNHKFFDMNLDKVFNYSDSKLSNVDKYKSSIETWKGIIIERSDFFENEEPSNIKEQFIISDLVLEYLNIEKLSFLYPFVQIKNNKVYLLRSKEMNSHISIKLIELTSMSELNLSELNTLFWPLKQSDIITTNF